jgi:membrane protein involved in colicin uptake
MTAAGRRIDFSREYIKIPISDLLESPQVKAAADLKAKQEADAKAAAELKAKQEADAKAAADLKAKQEADAKAAAVKTVATKKTTITCVKGKLTKKVTAVKPKCPAGYRVKK